jgi:hypothetical protein
MSRGIPTCRREYNIKMDLNKIGYEFGLYSSSTGKGPVMGSCEHGEHGSETS